MSAGSCGRCSATLAERFPDTGAADVGDRLRRAPRRRADGRRLRPGGDRRHRGRPALPARRRRGDRTRRRGRQDHLPAPGARAADERHLRRRHGRLHRPDGRPAADRRRRPRRPRRRSTATSTRSPHAAGCSPSPTCSRCSTRAQRTPTWPPRCSRPSPCRRSPGLPAATRSAATWSSSAARCTSCPQLREAYRRALAGQVTSFTTPRNAQLYVAIGAALLAGGAVQTAAGLAARLRRGVPVAPLGAALRPLFADEAERAEFADRHGRVRCPAADPRRRGQGRASSASTPAPPPSRPSCWTPSERIRFAHYASNRGDPVTAAVDIVRAVRDGTAARSAPRPGLRHRVRRGPDPVGTARRRGRGRDHGALPGGRARLPRRHGGDRHRRAGHEVPEDPQRRRRLDRRQRGLFVRAAGRSCRPSRRRWAPTSPASPRPPRRPPARSTSAAAARCS